MLSGCFYCPQEFGPLAPEALQPGDRIAFDPERGRFWVVCPACGRWNAAPLEERWELLEACERLAGDRGRVRLRTERLALLEVGGGEMVRVGPAPRIELAPWRYGDALPAPGRRGFWARFFAGLPDAPAGGYDYHGTPRPTPGSWLLSRFHEHAAALTRAFVTVPFAAACPSCGGVMPLDPHDFETLRLTRAEGESAVAATCAACNETGVVALSEARPALRLGLTVVTRRLRDVEVVEPAAARIDRAGEPGRFVRAIAKRERTIGELRPHALLALLIALDEQAEAEALEREWREAEEIARIMDRELTDVPGFEEFRARVLGQ